MNFWQNIKHNFYTFCEQTSLHGWQYISPGQHLQGWSVLRLVFWSAIVTVSLVCAASSLYVNTIDYMTATVVTTVDTMTAPLTEVFFPSVVVCNINQVRGSWLNELGAFDNEVLMRGVYEDYILGKKSHSPASQSKCQNGRETTHTRLTKPHDQLMSNYLAKHNGTYQSGKSLKWDIHQKCDDMFLMQKWNQHKTFEYPPNLTDFGTDYGICCWYTPQLNYTQIQIHKEENNLKDPDWGHWFFGMTPGSKTGKDHGFTMLFDVEAFDYAFYNEGSEGLKLALVHHLDMPIMRQKGFHIAPGTENQIAVTPTLMTTSANAMSRLSPDLRNCYSDDEISLKYLPRKDGYRYEMSNCLFEATFEKILEECKCAPDFHQTGGELAIETMDVCSGDSLLCMNHLLNRMGEFDTIEGPEGKRIKCYSACTDQENSLFVTTSSYPNRNSFLHREEFCIITKKIIDKCNGFKRRPLEKVYPNLCTLIEPLKGEKYCVDNQWRPPSTLNCSQGNCGLVKAIYNYAKDNLVLFNIFIKDSYVKRFIKDEKITRISFIANAGGLLGLCLGFSVISVAEILYHGVLFVCSSFNWSYHEKADSDKTADKETNNEGVIKLSDSELKLCQQVNYEDESDSFSVVSYGRMMERCYTRQVSSPCQVHHIIACPQDYGPYHFNNNTRKHKGHFTSPTAFVGSP